MSRVETILQAIVNETTYDDEPQSRIEDLLIQVKEVIDDLIKRVEILEGGNENEQTS